MKKCKFFIISAMLSVLALIFVSCESEEPIGESTLSLKKATIELPSLIPAEGASYSMNLEYEAEGTGDVVFNEWQYKISLGGVDAQRVIIKSEVEKVDVKIDANLKKEERAVAIYVSNTTENPQWLKVAESKQAAALEDFIVTEFVSSDIPKLISYNGGKFKLTFKTEVESRSEATFVPWQYRVLRDGVAAEAISVDKETTEIALEISNNYTEKNVKVAVETALKGEDATWTKIVDVNQDAALIKYDIFSYAKANIDYKDGKFIIAEKASESGLYFKPGSIHGVLSSEENYSGKAYTPAQVEITLADIPSGDANADPCSVMDPSLRTASYMELYYLFDIEDYQKQHILNGVNGMGFTGTDIFLPYGGLMNIADAQVQGKNLFGGYWGLGSNYEGSAVVYSMNTEYSLLDYDLKGENLAMVRCVRNVEQPKYVSHAAEIAEDGSAFDITVTTSAGAFELYEIFLEASDGASTLCYATNKVIERILTIPANEKEEERTWKIFVNRVYSGTSFVQPGVSNYAKYVSHTPKTSSSEAFNITVTYETDLISFPIVAKGSDGSVFEASGSYYSGSTDIEISANDGEERTFTIWLNNENTSKTVVQKAAPVEGGLSVEWSTGYLTAKDGAFVIAEPLELGMYFKWKSQYGILLPAKSTSKYEGLVYDPAENTTFADYASVPKGDFDPCSLVAPAGTWRMPTADETKEMFEYCNLTVEEEGTTTYKQFAKDDIVLKFLPAGQLKDTGTGIMLPTSYLFWTASEGNDDNTASYALSSSSSTTTPKISIKGKRDTGMMVRCVRSK